MLFILAYLSAFCIIRTSNSIFANLIAKVCVDYIPELAKKTASVAYNKEKTTKKIDFDKKTLKRLEVMIPLYREEIESDATEKEIMSYIVQKAIEKLFVTDFKDKLSKL